jgi:hypothetical protein
VQTQERSMERTFGYQRFGSLLVLASRDAVEELRDADVMV